MKNSKDIKTFRVTFLNDNTNKPLYFESLSGCSLYPIRQLDIMPKIDEDFHQQQVMLKAKL